MHKKVRGYILIIVLGYSYNIALSMKHESVTLSLQNLIREIPVLCINNYIVNASSAYEGFKKERFLNNDFIKSVNFNRRNCLRKQISPIPFRYDFPADYKYIKHSRLTKYPNFLYIHARCKEPSLQDENIKVELFIFPYRYVTDRGEFKCIPCSGNKQYKDWGNKAHEWIFDIIDTVVQDMINRGRKGKYGVELRYNNRISDWLIVEKNY